jgi:hypothetical protein
VEELVYACPQRRGYRVLLRMTPNMPEGYYEFSEEFNRARPLKVQPITLNYWLEKKLLRI